MVRVGPQPDAITEVIAVEMGVRVVATVTFIVPYTSPRGPSVLVTDKTDSEPVVTAVRPVTTKKGDASVRSIPVFFAEDTEVVGSEPGRVGPLYTSTWIVPSITMATEAKRVGTGLRPE